MGSEKHKAPEMATYTPLKPLWAKENNCLLGKFNPVDQDIAGDEGRKSEFRLEFSVFSLSKSLILGQRQI